MAELAAGVLHSMGGVQTVPDPPVPTESTPASGGASGQPLAPAAADGGDGGGGGTVEELTAKEKSARAITPNSHFTVESVKHWKLGKQSKPGLTELRNEVLRRLPDARPGAWDQEKLVNTLKQTQPPDCQPHIDEQEPPPLPPKDPDGKKRKRDQKILSRRGGDANRLGCSKDILWLQPRDK